MRILYSLVWWLILPLALFRLWRRGVKEPGYRRHIAERLGSFPPPTIAPGCLWVHAVSVGETRAAEPLVNALLAAWPDKDILLTCMTPAGRATGHELFGDNPRIMQAYLPYDTGFMMRCLIRHFRPRICILMETEVWPNLIAACKAFRIPVALVNARLSERSLRKGKRLPVLIQEAADGISCVAAQTETDAKRLHAFGSRQVSVVGSVKFDAAPPEEMIRKGQRLRACIGQRPVLICASTRDGEESLILDALPGLAPTNTLLLIVPRHPRRFDEVADLIADRGLKMARRSELPEDLMLAYPLLPDIQVLLGDSMGEMFAYYAASDLAFIGGSLKPLGGQNLIEACALGVPVIVGTHTFNFEAITEDAVAEEAAIRVHSAAGMIREAGRLLNHPEERHRMGEKARQFALRQRGATERTLALLRPLLAYD
ncbi:MAG: lipid IV(A) 3-deoxy-D-manno-octulosonic acid transferase [Burkholderiaceae bacterium]|jgi:3-deoxy-D-manno-octulosonic-acid transferase|nr:lipid IV(A) 3-deoxy-D-manno-octulosonic acid transferase [Burkholderiaceae bacterium]